MHPPREKAVTGRRPGHAIADRSPVGAQSPTLGLPRDDTPSPVGAPLGRIVALVGLTAAGSVVAVRELLNQCAGAWSAAQSAAATPVDLLVAGVAALAAALTGWLAIGVLLGLFAAIPGAVGAGAERMGRRLTPMTVRLLVALALGPAGAPATVTTASAISTASTVSAITTASTASALTTVSLAGAVSAPALIATGALGASGLAGWSATRAHPLAGGDTPTDLPDPGWGPTPATGEDTPRPTASPSTASPSTTSRPGTPQPTAPQPTATQPSTPQPTTPQPTAPTPSSPSATAGRPGASTPPSTQPSAQPSTPPLSEPENPRIADDSPTSGEGPAGGTTTGDDPTGGTTTGDTTAGTTSPAGGPATGAVVVRAGDSLWRIAERRLGGHPSDAAIDRAWRQWYSTNRSVIGADPDLILPGTRLLPPERN